MTTTAHAPVLPTYTRLGVTFTDGEGAWLTDADGNRYLDLFAGIAVVGLGHKHPAPLAAAHAQLDRLWHVSNLYWTEPMQALAAKLSDRFGGAQAFFCNSGAESVEAAIKWARKATGRSGIVALDGSFHGRTLGALSITGQPAKRAAFEPLVPGTTFGLEHVGPDTAAIVLEPVQGALLVIDEVQTGVGRSGAFFAWQRYGVRPDAVTLAKGLANGLPIGALLVSDSAPTGFEPGDHASTFGGNPVACAAACAVVDAIDDDLLAHVREMGDRLALGLAPFGSVRGLGLMLAVELDRPAGPVVEAALAKGLVIGSAGPNVLRLTPPLTITAAEIDSALQLLSEVLT